MATQSLFGGSLSPQEMQAQMLEQKAAQFAQMSPDQQLGMMAYKAGSNVGTGLAGAFGVETQDPMIRRATKLRELAGQYNTNTATGIRQMADALRTQDPEMALQLSQKAAAMDLEAAKLQGEQAKVILTRAQTGEVGAKTQESFDKRAALGARTQMLVNAGIDEVEASAIASNDTAFSKYVENKKVPVPSEYAVQAQKLGFTAKPYLSDYTPEQIKKMEQGVFTYKAGIAQAGATVNKPVDVASIIKEIGAKEDTKGKAETWKAAGEAYKMQIPMIAKLQEVKEALPKTFTGSFSDTALQFGKGLSALGIPVDRSKLANTEYMNSVSSQVLQTIARNFPGSLAVKEMDQLVKSKFNSQQQIETVSRILGDLQTEIEAGTKSYEQLAKLPETERYNKDLNYLTGQNFNKLKRYRALEQKANSLSGGQKMTKQEIEEAKKLQSDLGV